MDAYKPVIKSYLSDQAQKMREKLDITQEAMSENLHITPRAYGDLERGKYCFSSHTLLFFLSLMEGQEMTSFMRDFLLQISQIDDTEDDRDEHY